MDTEETHPEDEETDAVVLMYDLCDLITNYNYREAANYSKILKKRFDKKIPTVYVRNKFDVDASQDEWVKNVRFFVNAFFRILKRVAALPRNENQREITIGYLFSFFDRFVCLRSEEARLTSLFRSRPVMDRVNPYSGLSGH